MQSLNVDNRQENKQDNKTPLISRHSSKNFSSFASLTTASRSYNLMFIVQITLIVAMGGFIFGYDTGIIGGAALYFVDDFPLITSGEKETIVSLAIIGAAFGCLLIGPFSDNYGRKLSIILADFFFAAGAFLMYFAVDLHMLMAGRFIAGMAIGAASVVVPIYLVEVSFSAIRGRIVSSHQIFVATGQFMAYLIVIFCGRDWRLMLGLSGVPAIVQIVLMLCFPESPKWLMKMNRDEEAEAVLCKIFKADTPKGFDDMQKEINLIKTELQLEDANGSQYLKYRELFAVYKKVVFIGVMVQIWQQFTGINTVMYYAPTILDNAGFGSKSDHMFTLYVSLVLSGCLTVGCYCSIAFIDKLGRRYVMLRTLPGMGTCMCVVGLCVWLNYNEYSCGKWILAVSLFIYLGMYAIGMGATPNIINSEIYPIHLRGIGASMGSMGTWISNYLISAVFLTATDTIIGEVITYEFFGGCCALAFLFIYCLLPETKGRPIEVNIKKMIPNLEERVKNFQNTQTTQPLEV